MKLYPNRRTHIDTLADETPKSRRRVRWHLAREDKSPVTSQDVTKAQGYCHECEHREANRVAHAKAEASRGVVS